MTKKQEDDPKGRAASKTPRGFNANRRNFLRSGAAAAAGMAAVPFVGSSAAAATSSGSDELPPLGKIPDYKNYGKGASGKKAAENWVDNFLQPSTLTRDQQMKEMEYFINAAQPYKGMTITAVSEVTGTHQFESKILAQAFEQITGIKVKHDIMQEGDVVSKLESQMATGRSLYDIYINDSDFIGTHVRMDDVISITDYMTGEGKDVTLPTLDVDDFIGKSFVSWKDKMYMIPDGQFANLYWYRKDWFDRPDLQKQFKEEYGYDLDVPVNWSAYEDIADFFTNKVKNLDGRRIYGHMDYGKKSPSLGWRIHDSWLSMAGAGDKGLPNGRPVDDWGIRVNDDLNPVGASVERGGATNSPAAVYAIRKYKEWLDKYAPPEAAGMTFSESGPVPAQGHIAQQIFWYTAFTPSMTQPGLPVVNDDGTPKWRMAPSPHGPYWEAGMKLGYQDCGSWMLPRATDAKKRAASWLYAQFCICKSVSLRKSLAALTPFRTSDINSKPMGEAAPYLGGLVEFFRSPAHKYWTPTGVNVPAYGKLTSAWWKNIAKINSGSLTPQEGMDAVAEDMDNVMHRIEIAKLEKIAPPKLNPKKSAEYWFKQPGAPKPKLDNEDPPGETLSYDELLKAFNNPASIGRKASSEDQG
ncbi:extracellular solute-binding protein [Salinisphaera sp. SPP-AMP-43]|uniref:ABC transporter substrate-binding protein n=1 Tax=Salinisphaera sp. SPP-AMP-43 TaxID=3121288 RepID=UPI003C6DCD54